MAAEKGSYYIYEQGRLRPQGLRKIFYSSEKLSTEPIWSARLSSGLLGLTDCSAGNRGPKNINEVILARGHEGLAYLIWLGFTPCPSCHPENEPQFWPSARGPIEICYHLDDEKDFLKIDFDARRLRWEELPVTPNRLYVPPDLDSTELFQLWERFTRLGKALPPVGYYDREAPGHFRQYAIPV